MGGGLGGGLGGGGGGGGGGGNEEMMRMIQQMQQGQQVPGGGQAAGAGKGSRDVKTRMICMMFTHVQILHYERHTCYVYGQKRGLRQALDVASKKICSYVCMHV